MSDTKLLLIIIIILLSIIRDEYKKGASQKA